MLVGRKSKEEGSLGQLGQLGGRTGDARERQSKIVTARDGRRVFGTRFRRVVASCKCMLTKPAGASDVVITQKYSRVCSRFSFQRAKGGFEIFNIHEVA
jgi:hypothetical protein